jgi:hypothetical protein
VTGPTGAVGSTGPTGPTGPAGADGSPGSGTLFFNQIPGLIACFPPIGTEITVIDLAAPVTAGQNVKLDYALSFEANAAANSSFTFETRLYRDATLINSRTYIDTTPAGTFRITCSDTYVDTAPANATSNYSVRVIVTQATIISATASNRSLNAIVF